MDAPQPDVVVHLPSGPVAAYRSARANRYDVGGTELRRAGVARDGAELARLPCGRTARVEPYAPGALDIQRDSHRVSDTPRFDKPRRAVASKGDGAHKSVRPKGMR
jgi:hypothetical protein